MTRIAVGLAALSLAALTACGTTPSAAPTPAPLAPPAEATTAAPTAIPTETGSATATPTGTATATATPTATSTASPTATARTVSLPEKVETFNRVEQRTENDVRIGSYYSDSLKTVLEVRAARNRPARELLTSLGATNPTNVGPALCSTQGDVMCAQEKDGITVAAVSRQLPATMVSHLTTQFLDAVK